MIYENPILPDSVILARNGVSRARLQDAMVEKWNLSPQEQDRMYVYVLHKWKTAYFFTCLQQGKVVREGVTYNVVWHKCTPAAVKKFEEVLVSFRYSGFSKTAYILVKPFFPADSLGD